MANAARPFGLVVQSASKTNILSLRAFRTDAQLTSVRPRQPPRPAPIGFLGRGVNTTRQPPPAKAFLARDVRQARQYYTPHTPPEAPYPPTETAILSAASAHIPVHGFTTHALTLGAIDAGYLPASINLFPNGAFDLVLYHLTTTRLSLKDTVQFPDSAPTEHQLPLATAAKVRSLLASRLHANIPIIHKLPEALGLMSLPSNIPSSLRELALLVDEILYLAGDIDVSASWYTKRAALAGVYASSELFMTQDQSKDFNDTEHFVDRRLKDSETAAYAAGSVGQWLGFTGLSAINVLRSWGAKI